MKRGGASVTGVVDTTGGASGRALTEEVAAGARRGEFGEGRGEGQAEQVLDNLCSVGGGSLFF